MFGRNEVRFCKIFDIEITLEYSWFLILALIIFIFGDSFLPSILPGQKVWLYYVLAILGAILFFSSVIIHEMAHTLAARARGLRVKKITLFIFGGVSRLPEEPSDAETELWVAIAGPLASFAVGGVLISLSILLFKISVATFLFNMLLYQLGMINIYLGLFNLLPGYPLDGGRILRAILWWKNKNLEKATFTASNFGQIIGYLIMAYGVANVLFFNLLAGFWLFFIGFFIIRIAKYSYRISIISDRLRKLKITDVMDKDFLEVNLEDSVETVKENIIRFQKEVFLVKNSRNIIGTLNSEILSNFNIFKNIGIKESLIPVQKLTKVQQNDSAIKATELLTGEAFEPILVYDHNKLVGLVSLQSLDVLIRFDL